MSTKELHAAVLSADTGSVERLLRQGAEGLNELDEKGHAPLHWAVFGGYLDIVQLLLRYGADVNVRSKDGVTPLWNANDFGLEEIAALLREHGAHD